ncbi:MAG: hypothetical protein EOP83_01620 [Verrucomicrobiaceae bacterium]|nr:MAG: hypothetical protein EOP83_01620 [Verrucomicrobiaceae bacterium]
MFVLNRQINTFMCSAANCSHGPGLRYFQEDTIPARLDEIYYKDLMQEIVPNNTPGATNAKLPFRDWAPLVPSVKYLETRGNTMKFFVPNNINGWETYVQFPEWAEQASDVELKAPEAARLLLWGGNVKLHCHCPSFSYWGFNYILDQLDASIYHEDRYPHVRNPQLRGVACKHLIRTLKVLPFHLGDIAAVIKAQRDRAKL